MKFLRGLGIFSVQALSTPPFAILMVISLPLGGAFVYRIARLWCWLNIQAAECLGIRFQVQLDAPLPEGPAVLLSKHSSAWETFFMLMYFPPLSPVVKKELLSIPFFGWGLALCQPIAIDRALAREARLQVESQGLARLKAGRWVSIFPEGTRVPAGFRGRYARSGAAIALSAQAPIVAMAHDAGYFWRSGFLGKTAGTIQVRISAPILPQEGDTPQSLTDKVETWIEEAMVSFGHPEAQAYARKTGSR